VKEVGSTKKKKNKNKMICAALRLWSTLMKAFMFSMMGLHASVNLKAMLVSA
jgi:hypothetical protein